jgi:hypothetical protein
MRVTGKFLDAQLDDLSDVDIDGTMEGDDLLVNNGGQWQKGNFLNTLVRDYIPPSHEWEIKEHRQLFISQQLEIDWGILHVSGGLVRID